jgi:thiol-disulfide isomerase/thioredoxin
MKINRLFYFVCACFIVISCDDRPIATVNTIDKNGLQKIISTESEKIKVINFWATWCAPCIEEMPYFEEIGASYQDEIDVFLISLDQANTLEKAVQPFVEKNEIKSQVLLLDDPYAAEWIPIVDAHWDGAIPVTLIIAKNKKQFYNKALTQEELAKAINQFL